MSELDKIIEEKRNSLKSSGKKQSLGERAEEAAWQIIPPMGQSSENISKQLLVGVAGLMGLPKVGADMLRQVMGYEDESPFPSAEEIQGFAADWGLTYQPGEEPDDILSRFWQNIGASIIPASRILKGGMVAKTAITEGSAALGGAMGGKVLEATPFGERHPMAARAIGELSGGLAMSSTALLKKLPGLTPFGILRRPFKGKQAEKRAAERLREVQSESSSSEKRFSEALEAPEFEGLTASQKTGDIGVAGLRKQIEAEYPKERDAGIIQRRTAVETIEKKAVVPGSSDISDVRRYLSDKFENLANEADEAGRNIKIGDEVAYSKAVKGKVDEALKIARNEESRIWEALPDSEGDIPENLIKAYTDELSKITKGGDIKEIDDFARLKLGVPNKEGVLDGGKLINKKDPTASAKELHQFYSRLGRKIGELSEQKGQTNKIRVLNALRKAAFRDIEISPVGGDYEDAVRFSRELNEMFTEGALGKVLGFHRGFASPEAMFLDDLLGSGDQVAAEGLRQAVNASTETKSQIFDYIRTRFAITAKNQQNNKINKNTAETFMKKYRRVLDVFPELRTEFNTAIKKQGDVDEFMGVTKVDDLSPMVRDRTAASVILGSDPGEEVAKILRFGKSHGKTEKYMKELLDELQKDSTGKAQGGFKNALVGELLESSRSKALKDPVMDKDYVSGSAFLEKLNNISRPLQASGMMNKGEVDRLKKLGAALKNIELEIKATPSGSIVADRPGVILNTVARLFGARWGAQLGGVSPGGQIQAAGIGSKFAQYLSQKITFDEAKSLLIEATKDDKLMSQMLKNVSNLDDKAQMTLAEQLIAKAKELSGSAKESIKGYGPPVTSIVPPLVSGGKGEERGLAGEKLDQSMKNKIELLKERLQ